MELGYVRGVPAAEVVLMAAVPTAAEQVAGLKR